MRRIVLALLVLLAGCAGGVPITDGPVTPTDSASKPGTVDAPPSATPKDGAIQAEVVEVVDGDTVKVVLENGTRETVRLLGVDTPEVHSENTPDEFEGVPDTQAGRDCLRQWGEEASSYAKDRLLGETVTLSFDANEPRRGYYDRLLAYVHVDGRSFNYALITSGLARVYDSEFQYGDRYYEAESSAMAANAGVWQCREGVDGSTPTAAATETVAQGEDPLRVNEIHADAGGTTART